MVGLIKSRFEYVIIIALGILIAIVSNDTIDFSQIIGFVLTLGTLVVAGILLWFWKTFTNYQKLHASDLIQMAKSNTQTVDVITQDFQKVIAKTADDLINRFDYTMDALKQENKNMIMLLMTEKKRIHDFMRTGLKEHGK